MISDLERKLCERLPSFQCPPGCNECCSMGWRVSFNEYGDIVARQDDPPWECEYARNGRCAVYEDRPTACRIFFCSEVLPPCPRGVEPETKLTEQQTREFVQIWHWLSNGEQGE